MKHIRGDVQTDPEQASPVASAIARPHPTVVSLLEALPETEQRRAREALVEFVRILAEWDAAEPATAPVLARIGPHDPGKSPAVRRLPPTERSQMQAGCVPELNQT